MTRRFLIIALVLIFIVAPLLAWGVVYMQHTGDSNNALPTTDVTPATDGELLNAAQKQTNTIDDESDKIQILSIVSSERFDTWWYIITVRYSENNKPSPIIAPMLLVKYHDGPDSIRVMSGVGETLPNYNISNSNGIPYDVIDKYNEAVAKSLPDDEYRD